MKHSTTYSHLFRLLSLTVWAAITVACGNDDNISDSSAAPANAPNGIPFTATITTGESPTRALSNPGLGSTINATWAVNEQVALVYKVNGTTFVTPATVSAVSDGTDGKTAGTAIITATLNAGVNNGTDVTLIYPYSAVYTTGENIGKINDDFFTSQRGKLITSTTGNSISEKYDLRQGDGTIYYNGTDPASLSNNVTMATQVCIWKITPSFNEGTTVYMNGGKMMLITYGDKPYVITSETPDLYGNAPAGGEAYLPFKTGEDIYVALLADGTSKNLSIKVVADNGDVYAYSKSSVTLAASKYYQSNVALEKSTTAKRVITSADTNVTLNDGDIVKGTGGSATHITIADGATVTIVGLNNTSINNAYETAFAGIECLGNAHIILVGSNGVKGVYRHAGISVPENKTLTISGSGSLTATGNGGAAGIGGNLGLSCGNISITGGIITAVGSDRAAGIGCGDASLHAASCGNISISGSAHVMATGGDDASGIGSGFALGNSNTCGAITIASSAYVTATGGNYAAGIGSGRTDNAANTCGAITIAGSAHVTATGGLWAAGIGSGWAFLAANTCGDITISGSAHVTATGGTFAAGIGSGNGYSEGSNIFVSSCGDISITGGTVSATGGEDAVGIGNGSYGKFASINITNGITSVTAKRSNNLGNVPIGKGHKDQGCGSITIDGQTITDDMTKGTAALPTFPNLNVAISDGSGFTNGTWTITKK